MKDWVITALAYIGTFFVGVFAPVIDILLVAGLFIIGDIIAGSWAAVYRGEKLSSKKGIVGTRAKLIFWPLTIILAGAAQHVLPEIPFIKGAAFLIVFWEGKSIGENIESILGISIMSLFKSYLTDGKKGLIKELQKDKHDKATSSKKSV